MNKVGAVDDHRNGFTLIEVLVALVVAGLAFSLAFQTFSGAAVMSDRDRKLEQAVLIGQNETARVGGDIPFVNGTMHGAASGGFLWQIDIADGEDTSSVPFEREALKRVTTTVIWSTGEHRHEARFVTLRLAPRT